MTDLLVHPAERPLEGIVPAPPDAAAFELALVLAALAPAGGRSELTVRGVARSPVPAALAALGVGIDDRDNAAVAVTGVGLDGLRSPAEPLDALRSVSAMAILSGVLAGQGFESTLVGDVDIMLEVMADIAAPLRRRGGQLEGVLDPQRVGAIAPPLRFAPAGGGGVLSELSADLEVGAWPAKLAALVSGLFADGPTVLRETLVSHERSERLLAHAGASLMGGGPFVKLEPASRLRPLCGPAPGDAALAAVLVVAALAVPASRVGVRSVGVSPTRAGFAELLRHAGAKLGVHARGDRWGEPCADLAVASGRRLRALRLGGELAQRTDASLPTLAALASLAGEGEQSELFELPVALAYPNQPSRTLAMLHQFGIDAAPSAEGLRVRGGRAGQLRACELDSGGDPHIAMAAATLALSSDGPCRIHQADCIVESFPRFVGSLRALGARIDVTP